jgi:hypothetical protein
MIFYLTCMSDIILSMLELHLPMRLPNCAVLPPKLLCVMRCLQSSPIDFVNHNLLALELVSLLFLQSPRPDVLVQPCTITMYQYAVHPDTHLKRNRLTQVVPDGNTLRHEPDDVIHGRMSPIRGGFVDPRLCASVQSDRLEGG